MRKIKFTTPMRVRLKEWPKTLEFDEFDQNSSYSMAIEFHEMTDEEFERYLKLWVSIVRDKRTRALKKDRF
jgi:hypothetical protein